MSSIPESQHAGTVKAKKGVVANPPPRPAGPTTFFLRSEKDMEKGMQRGRKSSREEDMIQKASTSSTAESSFGVQSLEDTIASNTGSASDGESLSRTNSYASEASMDANGGTESVASAVAGRKRKAGNPVHPKILATGQRILSADYAARTGSPSSMHTAESSPLRRRNSLSSSVNLSQPMTPLKMSPQPDSALPSTPRSGSPKSFRLSDEEASIASDTGSQAIQSSSGEENEEDETAAGSAMPQLVMPSISLPARRPFTERGKRIGRLKVMVVGQKDVGKTSLIQSLCRACEDVVHLDSLSTSAINKDHDDCDPRRLAVEIGASTRPYPSWWTDFESRRMLLRRKSVGSDGVLERNLTFIDTCGLDGEQRARDVLEYFKSSLSRVAKIDRMNDIELVNLLSGEGGAQIDVVFYVFDPALASGETAQMDQNQVELLQYLCKWTNVIPLIGHADTVEADALMEREEQIRSMLRTLQAEVCMLPDNSEDDGNSVIVYGVSSAPTPPDELEGMDASLLMASGYIQPLVPSELTLLVKHLFEPDTVARLRHISATKFLLWRQENLGSHLNLQKQLILTSPHNNHSPNFTNTNSTQDDHTKAIIPHNNNSTSFRSLSPSSSSASHNNPTNALLALSTNPDLPYRQVRLAKWAQDLQRSLHNESKRYHQRIFARSPSPLPSYYDSDTTDRPDLALTSTNMQTYPHRPAKGHLGGDLAIFDPRDPLGVLAFSQTFRRRGWFVMTLAVRAGLLYTAVYLVERNWEVVREWCGFGEAPVQMVRIAPVTAQEVEPSFVVRVWKDIGEWVWNWNLVG